MIFDFGLLIFLAPALILAVVAQMMVRSAFNQGQHVPAQMTGFAAARTMLDDAGLHQVGIEEVGGHLSDHYDPRDKVLRLSSEVYHGHTASAIGIAAHEAGHALQDAQGYAPLVIRNAAVPLANFGGSIGNILLFLGLGLMFATGNSWLLLAGIVMFSGLVFFQLVNLPVEFNASTRAKNHLMALNIAGHEQMIYVRKVLNAAALTYVAATLQSLLTLLYYIIRYMGHSDD